MLAEGPEDYGYAEEALPIGLAWSFPIEQTSASGGKIQAMGKGFCCAQATVGHDLGELIVGACSRREMNLKMQAIINDSSATLLSRAYTDPSTSMSLILGTGTNMAAHLPVSAIGQTKFGTRDPSWYARAQKVITNTELSMFGKGILPETRWDEFLNRTHLLPDFQPLEYMTTGRYLGEILRLIIVEAVETADLFNGHLPDSLREPYSLDTAILAMLEEDSSPGLSKSEAYLEKTLLLPRAPSYADLAFLRTATESISRRAAAYLATAIHALWFLEKENSGVNPASTSGDVKTTISCNGSVIVKYPGFRTRCEGYIREMIMSDSSAAEELRIEAVVLEPAEEAAILGAAVAVAVCEGCED
jgi:hexokinase